MYEVVQQNDLKREQADHNEEWKSKRRQRKAIMDNVIVWPGFSSPVWVDVSVRASHTTRY